jgi:hypothetical protein
MNDPITNLIGSDDNNIKIIDDFLDEKSWEEIINFTKIINTNLKTKDHHVYQPLPSNIFEITAKYKEIIKSKAKELYKLDFIDDGNEVCLFVHPVGSSMKPHTDIVEITEDYLNVDYNNLDNIRKSGDNFPFNWTGHLATLVYINDDYGGGELYFPERNIYIKPKPRMLIMFPGNNNYLHGVSENTITTRFNLSLFIKFKDF